MPSLFFRLPLRRSSRDDSRSQEPEPKIKHIYAPNPLPTKRKRALTLPLPHTPQKSSFIGTGKSKQRTSPQTNSLFLQRLPYDVRRIVYDDILCGNIFHIIRLRRRLRHLRCSAEEGEVRDLRQTCWGILMVDGRSIRDFYNDRRTDGGVVPLMRTCRAITSLTAPSSAYSYSETNSLLYTQNIFDLNGLESILVLSHTILPQRLNSITSLRLTWAFFQSFRGGRTEGGWAKAWRAGPPGYYDAPGQKALFPGDEATWKACWAVVAGMQGLRDLRVWLAMSPATEMPAAVEHDLLSPLREVGLKRTFKIRVSWAIKDEVREGFVGGEGMVGVPPYEIIRQEDQDWGAANLRLQNR